MSGSIIISLIRGWYGEEFGCELRLFDFCICEQCVYVRANIFFHDDFKLGLQITIVYRIGF